MGEETHLAAGDEDDGPLAALGLVHGEHGDGVARGWWGLGRALERLAQGRRVERDAPAGGLLAEARDLGPHPDEDGDLGRPDAEGEERADVPEDADGLQLRGVRLEVADSRVGLAPHREEAMARGLGGGDGAQQGPGGNG